MRMVCTRQLWRQTVRLYPGWSTYNGPARKGVAAYAQIMLYYNYVTGAYFADLWKESALADRYRKLARNLEKKILNILG